MGHIFQTTRVVIWLIGNSDYSNVRKPGKTFKGDLTEEQKKKKEATYLQYKDITQAKKDVKDMEDFFKKLGFTEFFITMNKSYDDLEDEYDKIKKILRETKNKEDEKLSLFVYYSGHGCMDTTTKIMVNEKDPKEMYFALE
jgi:hypothetical protein